MTCRLPSHCVYLAERGEIGAAQKRERNRMVGMTGSKTTLRRVECSAAVEVEGSHSMKLNEGFYGSEKCMTSLFDLHRFEDSSVLLQDLISLIRLLDPRGCICTVYCLSLARYMADNLFGTS